MASSYECRICHVLSEEPDDLCIPIPAGEPCYQGPPSENALLARMCRATSVRRLESCHLCGRPSVSSGMVCMPVLH